MFTVPYQKFESILEGISEGLIVVESDWQIIYFNRHAESMTNVAREEALGSRVWDIGTNIQQGVFCTPELQAVAERVMKSRQCEQFDMFCSRRQRWYDIRINPVGNHELEFLFADITTRKATEAALMEHEARLEFALNVGNLGSWQLDLASHSFECTPTCRAHFGHASESELTYDDFWAAMHSDDRPRVSALIEKAVRDQQSFQAEFRIIWPDRSLHWLKACGRITLHGHTHHQLVGVTLDITQEKNQEIERDRMLQRAESARLQAESARLQLEGTRVLSENARAISENARLRSERLRLKADAARLDAENARHQAELARQQAELAYQQAKHSQHEAELARQHAEIANGLKDQFLATLSHELRTPLTAIIGWSELLCGNYLSGEEAIQAARNIEQNAKHQAQLVEDVLDVSRLVMGTMYLYERVVDLRDLMCEAVTQAQTSALDKGISLEIEPPEIAVPEAETDFDSTDSFLANCDPNRIRQVFSNLIMNGIKFTASGGAVKVRLSRAASEIVAVVSDTGQGIPFEVLPYIFDRFRQGDGSLTRTHGGLGIGLALVRQLIELHEGTIQVQSDTHGTTFTVRLKAWQSSG